MNAGYKIDTQKYDAFLYSNNKLLERETKKTIPFTITTKRIKYLRIGSSGDLVIRIHHFQCCGLASIPGQEPEILQAIWKRQKKNKKSKKPPIQNLPINLTKEVKHLYSENYDTDETEGDTDRHTMLRDGKNIVKMTPSYSYP